MRRDRQHSGEKTQRLRRFSAKAGAAGLRGEAWQAYSGEGQGAETLYSIPKGTTSLYFISIQGFYKVY